MYMYGCTCCKKDKELLYCKDNRYFCKDCIESGKLSDYSWGCDSCDKKKDCESYMYEIAINESSKKNNKLIKIECETIFLILKYKRELEKSVDSVNYYHGRRNVYNEANESYVKAEQKVWIYKQYIKDLNNLLDNIKQM